MCRSPSDLRIRLTYPRVAVPVAKALLQLWQQVVPVKLVDRLDVEEHLRGDVIIEHMLHPVLLLHASAEYLWKDRNRTQLVVEENTTD